MPHVASPKVTVGIPHYLRRKLLSKTLTSLDRNVKIPYHVIIVNDGPPLICNNPNITIINRRERAGLGAARQQILELTDTEYLFFLDDDIIVLPNSLELLVESLETHPELAAVSGILYSNFKLSEAANFVFTGKIVKKKQFDIFTILALAKDNLFFAHSIPISNTLFRTNSIKNLRFDPEYKMGYEHWDFFMQMYFANLKCAVNTKSIFIHLYHKSPRQYKEERFNRKMLETSRMHFINKWGYVPIDETVTRKDVLLRICKSFFDKSVLRIYAKVIFNIPRYICM